MTFRKTNQELPHWILRLLAMTAVMLLPAGLLAQIPPVIVGGGYRNPDAFQVAGGQVITIFLRSAQTLLPLYSSVTAPYRFVVADSVPLPTSLAGFSARVQRSLGGSFDDLAPAPIFAVQQLPICLDPSVNPVPEPPATPECWITAITLQIPFNVQPPHPFQITQPWYRLIVKEGKTDSTSVLLGVQEDSIHFVTLCERIGTQNEYNRLGPLSSVMACPAVATHADGTQVLAQSPAKPGEVIVLYAYGLGLTSPDPPPAGSATPLPAPQIKAPLTVQFDFRPSAGPSMPQADPNDSSPFPIQFAGLAPGQVGLYQINMKLPDVFPPVAPCTGTPPNLTINIAAAKSFDGAQICVAAGQ